MFSPIPGPQAAIWTTAQNHHPYLRDLLVYHETIQGHSPKTVDEYFLDLRSFFRYLKLEKRLVPKDTPMESDPHR